MAGKRASTGTAAGSQRKTAGRRIGPPAGGPPPSRRAAPPAERGGPAVPASVSLPEITVKGVLLGLALSILLGAANTYLGLRAGLTVAAAIPAAVVSMAVLKAFRRNNILENNMVQTIASAGTAVASGAIFTIPAIVILGRWSTISYPETTAVALCGGLLGVLFTVPIRKALILEERLPFPEGVATGEVLKAGAAGGVGIGTLALGGAAGASFKGAEGGLHLFPAEVERTVELGGGSVLGLGATLSPALLGVGAIIGLRIAALVFLGGLLGWAVGIPLYTAFAADAPALEQALADRIAQGAADGGEPLGAQELAEETSAALPGAVWSQRIRYVGVGAMLVGGVWSLIKLRKPLVRAVRQGVASTRERGAKVQVPRTEQELSYRIVGTGIALLVVPILLLYGLFTGNWVAAGVMAVIMLVTGFLFSAVGAYMAGLVGSSNTPISGVTILTLIVAAFTLLALGLASDVGPAAAVLVAGVIAVAGAIASDNLQDLKAGHIVGATPWKQQLMLMVGAVASAFFIAPVMQVLIDGAGGAAAIGSKALPAPQAGLMASVAAGIFGAGLPYGMVAIGAALAAALIVSDVLLARAGSSFRTPVMPVAVGIYLPVGLSVPIFAGGLAAAAAGTWYRRRLAREGRTDARWPGLAETGTRMAILFGSGLIAGEAILGIVTSFLAAKGLAYDPFALEHAWAGLLLLAYLVFLAFYVAVRPGLRTPR